MWAGAVHEPLVDPEGLEGNVGAGQPRPPGPWRSRRRCRRRPPRRRRRPPGRVPLISVAGGGQSVAIQESGRAGSRPAQRTCSSAPSRPDGQGQGPEDVVAVAHEGHRCAQPGRRTHAARVRTSARACIGWPASESRLTIWHQAQGGHSLQDGGMIEHPRGRHRRGSRPGCPGDVLDRLPGVQTEFLGRLYVDRVATQTAKTAISIELRVRFDGFSKTRATCPDRPVQPGWRQDRRPTLEPERNSATVEVVDLQEVPHASPPLPGRRTPPSRQRGWPHPSMISVTGDGQRRAPAGVR